VIAACQCETVTTPKWLSTPLHLLKILLCQRLPNTKSTSHNILYAAFILQGASTSVGTEFGICTSLESKLYLKATLSTSASVTKFATTIRFGCDPTCSSKLMLPSRVAQAEPFVKSQTLLQSLTLGLRQDSC
jgi:hypothetical protein